MEEMRRALIAKAAGLVSVMCAYVLFIVRRTRQTTPRISYGPMSERDIARQSNLRFIYHTDDTNCLNQLRMRRAPMAEAGGANGAQGGHQGVLRWTANMSSFMLRRMVELIAQGVKTDKGFKEVHLNQVARTVSEHYENYTQMAIIFGNGQATGRFAMGSNEALGNPVDMADSGLGPTGGIIGDDIAAGPSGVGAESGGTAARASGVGPTGDEPTGGSNSDKKRKRTPALDEGEVALISNMTDSVNKVASAILATAHTEVHPDLENSVMDLPGFSEDQLDLVLSHLTKHEAESLVYIQKNEARRARWDAEYLNVPLENYTQMAIIFGNGQATGRFAMGSNEALGNPVDMADSGLGPTGGIIGDDIAAGPSGVGAESGGTAARASGVGPTGDEPTGGSNSDKKRKRTPALDEGEVALISNMTDSVNKVASAILATAHTEVHPDLENSVMDLPGFSEDQLDLVLSHLTKHEAESLVYIQKNEARRARWVKKFLEEHHPESI
uniref:Uncharacterized protein n=1 Tax=Oryza punctata TaxID=4537 RepID=A0A0E0KKI4_ORYPU